MQSFLDQPEATFYHICPLEAWDNIDRKGVFGRNNEIYVSRVGEMPVLAAIAMEQLDQTPDATGIAVLKIPQALNNFTVEEIFEDYRAPHEKTGPFQNIIRRSWIPPGHFETVLKIEFGQHRDFHLDWLNNLAAQANINYPIHYIYQRAKALKINRYPELPSWKASDESD